jgi:hypothetical protein
MVARVPDCILFTLILAIRELAILPYLLAIVSFDATIRYSGLTHFNKFII